MNLNQYPIGRRLLATCSAALLGTLLVAGQASAQTVADIKASGILKVGSQVAQVPWGFYDSDGKLTGFDIELSRMLAQDLGVKAEFTPVTPANRTAALLTGQVDVLAAVMGIYVDRQKVVLFSRPYTNLDTIFIGRTGLNVAAFADMRNLRVGVARGTPQDIAVTKAAPSGATIQRFDDESSAVQALISGQVDVMGGAATQLPNIAQVAGPGRFEQKFVVARNYDAFALRHGSRELANAINGFIGRKLANGELSALYTKWFGGTIADLPTTGEGPAALSVVFAQ